jgi:hypothetical protein
MLISTTYLLANLVEGPANLEFTFVILYLSSDV